MLSRIADSLFWMQRYIERADGMLRLIKTSYVLSFDQAENSAVWMPSLQVFTGLPASNMHKIQQDNAAALCYLITDLSHPNSLKMILQRARENARGVQDQITKEVWEQINQLYHLINQPDLSEQLSSGDALAALDELIENSDQLGGIIDSTMPRGQGWNYLCMGKFTERSLITTEYLQVFFKRIDFDFNKEADILFWRGLLLALSGYELHLKNYSNHQHNHNVVQQVLFDKHFPRSVYYSFERAQKYLNDIVVNNQVEGTPELSRMFGRIYSQVKYGDVTMVKEMGAEIYLQNIREALTKFNHRFGQVYFSYA